MTENKILIVTSVKQEKEALLKAIGEDSSMIDVQVIGVGPFEAAARTMFLLTNDSYSRVINIGIGGGVREKVELGETVLASSVAAPELGADSPDGFLSIEELGFGSSIIPSEPLPYFHGLKQGVILTVATATGTEKRADDFLQRYPDFIAEGMEGFGAATAAKIMNIPFHEVRVISNHVGKRNKAEWNFPKAFKGIREIGRQLKEAVKE